MSFLVRLAATVPKRVHHDSDRSLQMSNNSPNGGQLRVSREDFTQLLQATILAFAGVSLLPKRAPTLSGLQNVAPELPEQLGNIYFLMCAVECKFDSRGSENRILLK